MSATDSIVGHTVSYSWSAVCAGGLGAGTFAPDAGTQSPTWTAPANATGATQACTLTVSASDGLGQTDTRSVGVQVQSVADVVTITAGPIATPEPAPSGSAVSISLSAVDSIIGHTLTYSWTAVCAGGLGAGTFTPNAAVASPAWMAPVNATGAQQACTLTVLVADSFGQSDTASLTHRVDSVADVITVTAGPVGTPDPVGSSGTTALTVAAVDSIIGHELSYAWSASCSGGLAAGSFVPTTLTQNPTWSAPVNLTGVQQVCTVTVTVTDGHGQSAIGTFAQRVDAAPDIVTLSAGPAVAPAVIESSGSATLTVQGADPYNHPLLYAWTAACPGIAAGFGTFSPSAATQNPTWTAPVNATGVQQVCTLSVAVTDGNGTAPTGSTTIRVNSVPDQVTITAGPTATPDPRPRAPRSPSRSPRSIPSSATCSLTPGRPPAPAVSAVGCSPPGRPARMCGPLPSTRPGSSRPAPSRW